VRAKIKNPKAVLSAINLTFFIRFCIVIMVIQRL